MGTVASACENCFGGKQQITKPSKKNIRSNDYKTMTESDANFHRNFVELTKSLNSSNGTLNRLGRSRTATVDPVSRKSKGVTDKNAQVTLNDFVLIKVLGRGSFGKVYFVQKNSNKKFYALKTLKKEEIQSRGQIEMAMTEKSVLQKASHPFVVKLHYSFQTDTNLYFVMDFCAGGELFTHLKNNQKFSEETTLFYAAEIILALEYLHDKLDIIYRDLKPENILLDATGHIKLTDFGLSKATKKGTSFCGTPEYLAPEILNKQAYNNTVDWWSLGCVLYEMMTGHPPFSGSSHEKLFHYILETEPHMPSHLSKNFKDLLTRLLMKDPAQRLGANGAEELKNHPCFQKEEWNVNAILKKQPPFVPVLTKPNDLRYFNKEFLKQTVAETPPNNLAKILEDPDMAFPSFDFMRKELGGSSGAFMEENKLLKAIK